MGLSGEDGVHCNAVLMFPFRNPHAALATQLPTCPNFSSQLANEAQPQRQPVAGKS